MNTDLTAILDKIARLRGLADRPGTPEEAAAAVAAIQRLMLRYNLTQAQVDGASRNDQHGYEKVTIDLGAGMNWRRYLLHAICDYSFCKVVFPPKGRGAYIIGEQHNIAIVTGLYDYLVNEVMRLADVGWDVLSPMDKRFSTVRAWKNSFRIGAGQTLRDRLKAQFEEQKRAEGEASVNALVVVKNDALARAMREFFPNSRQTRSRSSLSDRNGYNAGVVAGRSINLAKQIEA